MARLPIIGVSLLLYISSAAASADHSGHDHGSGDTSSTTWTGCVYNHQCTIERSNADDMDDAGHGSGSGGHRRLAAAPSAPSTGCSVWQYQSEAYWCSQVTYEYFRDTGSCTPLEMAMACNNLCPAAGAADYKYTCGGGHTGSDTDDVFHPVGSNWRGTVYLHSSLQWPLFFLIISVILGAFFKCAFDAFAIPYTVGLLVVFTIVGIIAGTLESETFCPHHAWKFDRNHNGEISRAEWDEFRGVGYNPGSFCFKGDVVGTRLDDAYKSKRVCGTGTAEPRGVNADAGECMYTFDNLDVAFKLSGMHTYQVNGHQYNNSVLSADELWTGRCNLFRDMVSLTDMDPHMILTVFLPALLFESAAFGVDMGIFWKQKGQILMMAFPAMITASMVTGLLIWAMFPDWTYWVCWLIGVITSATDPVAVVALLKDLGAAKTLGTLIEGESLLNDGSAVVLFTWVRASIGYDVTTYAPGWMHLDIGADGKPIRYTGDVVINFVVVVAQMLVFGVIFGLMFGYVTRQLLRFVYNDRFIEGTLIIGMSYLCFWIGELIVGTSAVIAVVVMGLYFNLHKSAMSPDVLHYMHHFYEMIAHILNTVIFAIAGTKLGTLLSDRHLREIGSNLGWGKIIAIYPIVLFTRGLAILIFSPALKFWGTKATWQEMVVCWWGGLRGSVGLALALVVAHTEYDANMWGPTNTQTGEITDTLDCRDQPMMVLWMNLVVVAFTVWINGVTMAPLMKVLKLTKIPEDRRFQLNTAYLQMKKDSDAYFKKLTQDRWAHAGADWDYVQNKMVKHYTHLFHDIKDHERAAWMAVLCLERASYLAQFEEGILSDHGFEELEAFMAGVTAQAGVTKTEDLSELYDHKFRKLLKHLDREKPSVAHKKLVYEIFVAYHNAQEEAKHVMHLFEEAVHFQKAENEREMEEIARASSVVSEESSVGAPSGPDATRRSVLNRNAAEQAKGFFALKLVQREHDDNVEDMEKLFRKVEDSCITPKAKGELALWKSQHALTMMLLHQRKHIEHMKHEGVLTDLDAGPLLEECNKRLGALQREDLLNDQPVLNAMSFRQKELAKHGVRAQSFIQSSMRDTSTAVEEGAGVAVTKAASVFISAADAVTQMGGSVIGSDSPLRRSTFAAKPELSHAASSGVGKPIKKEEDEKQEGTIRVFKLAKSAVEVVAAEPTEKVEDKV